MISVGLIQSNIFPHQVSENLEHYASLLEEKITKPVQLLVFPETFSCGFSSALKAEAEAMSGKSVQFLQETALKYSAEVVASVPILEDGKVFNRLVWCSPTGIRDCYDKRHLFMGDEEKQCQPGTRRTIIEALGYKFLPLICYDVRFPMWSRNHYADGCYEYDVLIYIANFPSPREGVLRKLAVARAIENQAYVLVVNRVGQDGNHLRHSGGTAVISPQGEVLCAAADNQEAFLQFDLNMEDLSKMRTCFAVAKQWDTVEHFPTTSPK